MNVGYLTGVSSVRIASPFPHDIPAEVYARAERFNFIDDHVLAKLRISRAASGRVGRAFIRRAYLDATGMLPTAEEVERSSPTLRRGDKRAALIDALLASEEFVDYWAYKWSDLLLVSSGKLARATMWSFYRWIRQSVAENKPWDRFAREIITATGRSTRRTARSTSSSCIRTQIDLTENFTQAFLGLQHDVRALPQPSAGEVDPAPVLRVREPVRARAGQERTRSSKGDASLLVVNSASGEIRIRARARCCRRRRSTASRGVARAGRRGSPGVFRPTG